MLHTRRFFCDAPGCACGVFTERVAGLVEPYGRRTVFVDELLEMVACLTGGRTGSKAAQRLRLVRCRPAAVSSTPRVLGVDDWAKRKGHTYGTILCDLETHRVIDLLADRESQTLADWLTAHAGVEVICRDRAGAYAEGARLGAPHAVQVADRFHLLMNLRDAVERSLEKHRAQLTVQVTKGTPGTSLAPAGQGSEDNPIAPIAPVPPVPRFSRSTEVVALQISSPIRQQQAAQRDLRRARYQHAHDLKAHGLSLRAIGRTLNATRRTVQRLLESDHFPEHARRGAKLKPFDDYLRQRWTAGVRNARQLYAEIHARGYAGSYLEVTRWVQPWRAEAPRASPSVPVVSRVPPVSTPVIVSETRSPRQVSYWFVLPPDRLTADQTDQMQQLLTAQPPLAPVYTFAPSHSVDALHTWIDALSHSHLPELNGFAQGLLRDSHAVAAAITTPHSSGQVEG